MIIFSNKFFNRYNTVLWDILLKIPGINSKNIKDIMDKVNNLCDLCQKTEEELYAIVENAKNAKLIYKGRRKKLSCCSTETLSIACFLISKMRNITAMIIDKKVSYKVSITLTGGCFLM